MRSVLDTFDVDPSERAGGSLPALIHTTQIRDVQRDGRKTSSHLSGIGEETEVLAREMADLRERGEITGSSPADLVGSFRGQTRRPSKNAYAAAEMALGGFHTRSLDTPVGDDDAGTLIDILPDTAAVDPIDLLEAAVSVSVIAKALREFGFPASAVTAHMTGENVPRKDRKAAVEAIQALLDTYPTPAAFLAALFN